MLHKYTFVSLYWACYIVCSKRGKCNIWITYKYTGYSRIFTRVYKFNTKDSTLQQLKKEKKKKIWNNPMTVCLIDHVKWIDKWIGTKTDVSRQVGKNLYARRGTYDSSLWTTLVLFVEKKKKKKKERMEDAQDLRLFLASNKRGEKMQPLWQIECDTMAANNDVSRCSENFRPSYCHVSALLRLLFGNENVFSFPFFSVNS